jgi:hypothetical protein
MMADMLALLAVDFTATAAEVDGIRARLAGWIAEGEAAHGALLLAVARGDESARSTSVAMGRRVAMLTMALQSLDYVADQLAAVQAQQV